jgi:hypothetical protein
MSNYIGRLTAQLTARDDGFSATLTKAQSRVSSFGNEATKHTKTISAASASLIGRTSQIGGMLANNIGALAGGLSVLGVAYTAISQVSQSLERLGAAADGAAKLGMQAMPEFLQGLQYHASLVGVQADSVTSSLSKLFRTIAEANAGSKSDRDILSALGLSASGLGGLTPDKAVLRVADALDKVADSGERARLAVALFGKSGGDMVNVLRGGSSAVSGGIGQAQYLGVARSASELAKADEAGDAIDRLKAATDGLWNELAISIAPALEGISNFLTDQIVGFRQNTTALSSLATILVGTSATIATIADGIGRVRAVGSALNPLGQAYGFAKDLYAMRYDNAYPDGSSMFMEAGRRVGGRMSDSFNRAISPDMPGLEILDAYEKAKVSMAQAAESATTIAAETSKTASFMERVGAMLDERVAKTNAILAAEKERTKTARDKYWLDLESARQARIAEAAATSRSVAESLATELMQEQEQLQTDADAREQRINDMMRNPGGAPTIISGSAEDQLARFNAANASMQSVAERQLTIQQRIDKELTRIREKNEAVERLFQEVLNRFPVINPV